MIKNVSLLKLCIVWTLTAPRGTSYCNIYLLLVHSSHPAMYIQPQANPPRFSKSYVVRMHACMYVCTYVCMYAFMHACMYVRMYVCMYVCMHARMHACIYACIYERMYVCMCVCIYVYMSHSHIHLKKLSSFLNEQYINICTWLQETLSWKLSISY